MVPLPKIADLLSTSGVEASGLGMREAGREDGSVRSVIILRILPGEKIGNPADTDV